MDNTCKTCQHYHDDGQIAFMGICQSPPDNIELKEVSVPSAFSCNKWELKHGDCNKVDFDQIKLTGDL